MHLLNFKFLKIGTCLLSSQQYIVLNLSPCHSCLFTLALADSILKLHQKYPKICCETSYNQVVIITDKYH